MIPLIFFFLLFFQVPQVWAIPFAGSHEVRLSEDEHFRFLMMETGQRRKLYNFEGKKEKWIEIQYKLVLKSEEAQDAFSSTGWVRVGFLDSEGFAMAEDALQRGEIVLDREYFGRIWVLKEHLKQVKSVAAESIPSDRAQKIRAGNQEIIKAIRQIEAAERAKALLRHRVESRSEGEAEEEEAEEEQEEEEEEQEGTASERSFSVEAALGKSDHFNEEDIQQALEEFESTPSQNEMAAQSTNQGIQNENVKQELEKFDGLPSKDMEFLEDYKEGEIPELPGLANAKPPDKQGG